ncbi:MAG TPA: Nramp family divalent metal transporter, partial [Planctomycetaceae bacterium]|nr:Nramp family divalent metal transporter [Planctomycetaceae bacterium]
YGGGLMWLATISILLQVFYNIECGRYALYCGEPIFTGFLRTRPGPRFWVGFFLLLSTGGMIPGLAFNAASVFGAAWLGRPPIESDRTFILMIAYGCIVLIVLPVLFGGKIYNTLQAIMSVKVFFVLATTLVLGVWLVSPSSWWNVFSGFLKFGTVPTKDALGNPEAVNAITAYFGGGPMPVLDLAGISVIAAFAGVAGGGGLSNSLYSNYVRDKGWGMGSRVGAIPSAIGGKQITLSHLGTVFLPTADNLRKWRGWWRYILVEQWWVWTPGCFIGMALPALLSMEFSGYSSLTQVSPEKRFGWAQPVISADGLRHMPGIDPQLGLVLWLIMLVVGLMILLPSQMSTVDEVCRRWTDVIWSANPHVRNNMHRGEVRVIYYSLLVGYVLWCCVSLLIFGVYFSPKAAFLVVANVGNIALGVSSFLILWINTRFLPVQLRPRWYYRVGLFACGTFYLGLAVLVFRVDQWPVLKEQLSLFQNWLNI